MRYWKFLFTTLFLILAGIGLAILQSPDKNLHIVACDVGQGDAILITYKNTQILTDGGPDSSVLECLGSHIPFYDRQIELMISTHPDADHLTGLISVLQNYQVDKILVSPIDPGTSIYQALKKEVGGRGVEVINPISGMQLGVDLIRLDIVHPPEVYIGNLTLISETDKLSKFSIKEGTNLNSVVFRLEFKNFSGFFPGDIPAEISDQIASSLSMEPVNYIKIPHHGSTNGLTENLLDKLVPESNAVGVISVGKNSWGFPRPEILDMLTKYNVKVYRTDLSGDIEVVTDGEKYWID